MSQTYGVPQSGPVTPAVMYDAIQDSLDAVNSGNLGASRPSYATTGTVWHKDVSGTVIEVYVYDGTQDILQYSYNPTTGDLIETVLANNQVGLGKLAQIATARFLGRSTAGTGDVEAMTAAQATALLPAFTGDSGAGGVKGLVPAPSAGEAAANEFLSADGTFKTTPAGATPGQYGYFAMSSPPSGWLEPYGQAVSRATYAALYSAIGDTYGAGNGTTTFNLPDVRGRVIAGLDNMGGVPAGNLTNPGTTTGGINGTTLGAKGGAETHSLTATQNGPHTHTTGVAASNGSAGAGPGASAGSTGSSGTGAGHNNVQPTIIGLICIKT